MTSHNTSLAACCWHFFTIFILYFTFQQRLLTYLFTYFTVISVIAICYTFVYILMFDPLKNNIVCRMCNYRLLKH